MVLSEAEKSKRKREKKAANNEIYYRRYVPITLVEPLDSVLRGESKIVKLKKVEK